MNKYDIFISYRAKENGQKAEHLHTLLIWRYPGQVSYDKDTFVGGRWDEQILSRIDHCKDVIVLLTPETFPEKKESEMTTQEKKELEEKYMRWAQMPAKDVLREIELGPQADILRLEISRAIAKGKNIVPVVHTPTGTNFSEWEFPRDISALTRFEAVLYNDDDPNMRIKDLVPKIVRLLKTRSRWMYIIALFLLVVSIASFMLWPNGKVTPLSDQESYDIYKTTVVPAYEKYCGLDRDSVIMDPMARKDSAKIVLKACSEAIDKGAIGAYYTKGVVYGDLARLGIDSIENNRRQKEEFKKGDKKGSYRCTYGLGNCFHNSWDSLKDSNEEEALKMAKVALTYYEMAKKGEGDWKLEPEDIGKMKNNIERIDKWMKEKGYK